MVISEGSGCGSRAVNVLCLAPAVRFARTIESFNSTSAIVSPRNVDGTMDGAEIVNDAVDSAEIVDVAGDGAEVIDGAIDGEEIVNGEKDGAEVAAEVVDVFVSCSFFLAVYLRFSIFFLLGMPPTTPSSSRRVRITSLGVAFRTSF